jgi:beta-lactamase regulating signal transducer with metallopeptidase domain
VTVAGIPLAGVFARTGSVVSWDKTRSLFTLPDHWAFILFSVWLFGVFASGAHLLLGMLRLRGLRLSCRPIDSADLDPALAEIAREFSSSHSVTLACSDKLNVPSAIGFFRPMIVIPAWSLKEFTPEEFKIILLHEFAHLRRRDDWTNLLQKIVRTLFIFHPAVWWIERQLSREREMACDDHVLAETGNPRGYAKCLVALLERSVARRALAMAQAAVHRADEARERLARILDRNRMGGRRFGKPAIGLAGVFSLLCLAVVPHVPELVAFAPSAIEAHAMAVPVFDNLKLGSVSVVPAAMHVRTTRSAERAMTGSAEGMASPAMAIKATPNVPRVLKAKATRHAAPAETILVIRTTEQIAPDAWISRVTVWRLTWIPARSGSVPAAKTT